MILCCRCRLFSTALVFRDATCNAQRRLLDVWAAELSKKLFDKWLYDDSLGFLRGMAFVLRYFRLCSPLPKSFGGTVREDDMHPVM
jgi:hypothetical protein